MLGAKHIGQPGVILTLAAGDARWNLRLAIAPYGAIAGKVFDGDGDPMQNVEVEILQQGWERGKPQWQQRGTARTDDRGEYRLQAVSAGKYYAMAAQTQARPRQESAAPTRCRSIRERIGFRRRRRCRWRRAGR